MGYAASPHDFAHGVVIGLVLEGLVRGVDYRHHQGLGNSVRQGVFGLDAGKISFQRVHKNIGSTADKLLFRYSIGQFRIHKGQYRAVEWRVEAGFFAGFFIGDDR